MNDLEKALNVCNAINNDLADIVNDHDLMAIVAKTLSSNGDESIRQLLEFTADGLPIRDPEEKSLAQILKIERQVNKNLDEKFRRCFVLLKEIYLWSAGGDDVLPSVKNKIREYITSEDKSFEGIE